jgi:hypothetical protein
MFEKYKSMNSVSDIKLLFAHYKQLIISESTSDKLKQLCINKLTFDKLKQLIISESTDKETCDHIKQLTIDELTYNDYKRSIITRLTKQTHNSVVSTFQLYEQLITNKSLKEMECLGESTCENSKLLIMNKSNKITKVFKKCQKDVSLSLDNNETWIVHLRGSSHAFLIKRTHEDSFTKNVSNYDVN